MNFITIYNTKLEVAFTTVGVILSKLYGDYDKLTEVFIILLILDVVSGVLGSFILEKFDSAKMRKGIVIHKALMFVVVIVAVQLDRVIGYDNTFKTIVLMFFCANEGLSILENLNKCGVKYPSFIEKMFIQMQENADKGVSDNGKD